MKRGIHFEVVWFGLLPGLTFEFKQSTRTFSFLGITLYATTNESCPIAYSMIEGYVRKRSTKRADEVGGRRMVLRVNGGLCTLSKYQPNNNKQLLATTKV